ncbi:MAG: cupin domain-containing protein [Dysgonamonadaceae bacterium]|jgi:transcriptional regulator with XRE-family HTH domain|nr:cupin domain-containing protein [Dysgonamonadaceae bacterium]MDD3308660.1 cupin domain-containing protein [Dysgonamonadaceae bacterium]MDD3899748.1 cupin domain-containing protein [Dysgonamonadaceae bacterium]MDD4397973.1 cupin domain-containing protein [Dysgonamonadaceae bacterium]MEA5081658.1 cupin domain-containing protein [Dysgonamonadaceae bacterium]
MTTDLKQIGERIKGLRDALDLSPEEMAQKLEVEVENYLLYEDGEKDVSVSFLQRIEREFNIDISTIMFGTEPRMNSYFITRKDKGVSVERVSAYKYQSLTAGFSNNVAEIFIVTVEPKPMDEDFYRNIHPGQEFNFVLEGSLMLNMNGKNIVLNQGDSIYFDSTLPHGMKSLHNKPVKFLAVILYP